MQLAAARDPFNGGDLASLCLHAQHQAGGNNAVVHQHGACSAVAVVAALLAAGQTENVAQAFEQALARLAQELLRLAIDSGLDTNFGAHQRFPSLALWAAASSARRVSTLQRCRRESAVPGMSVIGLALARAISAARAMLASLTGWPASASPASRTNSGVGATEAKAIRAERNVPLSSTTSTPAPATAISISLRGMKRR